MCDVPRIAVSCSESIECFPGTASKFFIKLLVTIPVAPIITGIVSIIQLLLLLLLLLLLIIYLFITLPPEQQRQFFGGETLALLVLLTMHILYIFLYQINFI